MVWGGGRAPTTHTSLIGLCFCNWEQVYILYLNQTTKMYFCLLSLLLPNQFILINSNTRWTEMQCGSGSPVQDPRNRTNVYQQCQGHHMAERVRTEHNQLTELSQPECWVESRRIDIFIRLHLISNCSEDPCVCVNRRLWCATEFTDVVWICK